jgi:hypothetical protein
MTDVVMKIARVVGSFAAKRPAVPGLPRCPHCGASRMVRSYVRYKERWRGHLLNRSPFRCGTCSRRSWHQAAAVVPHAVDDQAWRDACREPDIDTLDLSEVDRQLKGTRAGKIASFNPPIIDWQIVALVRTIQERIQELQSRQHGTTSRARRAF